MPPNRTKSDSSDKKKTSDQLTRVTQTENETHRGGLLVMLPKSIARPHDSCSNARGNRTGSEEHSKVSRTLQYDKRDILYEI